MSMRFKTGDVVKLRSGGPMMTVTYVQSGPETVHTTWFSGDKQEIGSFPVDALRMESELKLKKSDTSP